MKSFTKIGKTLVKKILDIIHYHSHMLYRLLQELRLQKEYYVSSEINLNNILAITKSSTHLVESKDANTQQDGRAAQIEVSGVHKVNKSSKDTRLNRLYIKYA